MGEGVTGVFFAVGGAVTMELQENLRGMERQIERVREVPAPDEEPGDDEDDYATLATALLTPIPVMGAVPRRQWERLIEPIRHGSSQALGHPSCLARSGRCSATGTAF